MLFVASISTSTQLNLNFAISITAVIPDTDKLISIFDDAANFYLSRDWERIRPCHAVLLRMCAFKSSLRRGNC